MTFLRKEKRGKPAPEDEIQRLKFELRHVKSQLFRFENIRDQSNQLELLTGQTRIKVMELPVAIFEAIARKHSQHALRYKGGCWETH